MNAHRLRYLRHSLLLAPLVILAAGIISCVSSDAVATFASNAVTALDQGTAIFDDMPASVLRRDCYANIENREFNFKPTTEACVSNPAEQENLDNAKKERDDLVAVQKVLIDYFTAIQQLAAFGKTTDSGGKSKGDSAQAGSAATNLTNTNKVSSSKGFSPDEGKAATSLAGIMVRAFSAGYRNRQLSQDIGEAEKAVPIVTAALTRVVKTDYMFDPNFESEQNPNPASLLDLEAHRMQSQFKDADGGRLLLRMSWTDYVEKLLARNSSAQKYVEALEKIQSGHQQLAKQPTQLKAQGLATALEPYISDLQSLIPSIQKVL